MTSCIPWCKLWPETRSHTENTKFITRELTSLPWTFLFLAPKFQWKYDIWTFQKIELFWYAALFRPFFQKKIQKLTNFLGFDKYQFIIIYPNTHLLIERILFLKIISVRFRVFFFRDFPENGPNLISVLFLWISFSRYMKSPAVLNLKKNIIP